MPKRLGRSIGDIATKDEFKLRDTFAHIDEVQKDLDVQKAFALENDGKGIETLQGKGSTIEEKQAAIKKYAEIYAKAYGINIEQARIVATSKVIGGTHYGKDGTSSIAINDNAQRNAMDYANTMGHEVTHARVSQGKVRDRKDEKLNEQYADTMGSYSADGMEFSAGTYSNINLNQNEVTNTHTQTAADAPLLTSNNTAWRANLKRARNGDGEVDYLLPEIVKKWRDGLNQYMDENRKTSASLKGDAVGTALSIAAVPSDIVVDLANVLITTVDVTTDGLGATGMLGKDLQQEAFQNLSDMGVKIDNLVKNREAIAASVVKTLKEYPDRIKDLDPSALRSLTAIVGEAAMPVAALARLKKAEEVAKVAKLPDLQSGYSYRKVGKQVQVVRKRGRKADLPQMRLVDGKLKQVSIVDIPVSELSYKKLVKGIGDLDVSAGANQTVFYSGRGARKAAEEYAINNRLKTLEQTKGGEYLDGLKLFEDTVPSLNGNKAVQVWGKLSSNFAEQAKGKVVAMVNKPRENSIFLSEELPILLENKNVTKIVVQSLNGKSVTIQRGTSMSNALKMIEGF